MTALRSLWELSLALCLFAALALLLLLFARLAATRSTGRRGAARTRLLPLLLDGDTAKLERLSGVNLEVAAELSVELAEMTRGSEREELLARAAALGVPAYLSKRMRSLSAQVRLSAIEALSMFNDCQAESLKALDDRNPDVRLGAALALAQRSAAPPPLTLLRKLSAGQEENSLLLVSLIADLAETDVEAVAGLLFEKDLSQRAKVAAIDALAQRGGEYAPLLTYMARKSIDESDVQPRLFRALGRTGHPAAAKAIIEGMQSDNWTVRVAAAEAAGKAGILQAADRLGDLLDDSNYWVRYRASEALLRLGPRGIQVLRAASASDDVLVAGTATKMLREGKAA
ncbi:HEAT repeat domain-containing protein [Qipengyuania atrilutea]|uniref:HEAT repeat domain-containing protein n=1 Tax=Qipengyuania atrilutea TaxID=2744473 RepID=A0A850H5J3_9SPHN|nr:HEAT repeat domain-containing protein [Actirhodobacter atriluteus]NVD45936.1 HEAT repeat domain-containing protein [Actirhodobacter atriluteus]